MLQIRPPHPIFYLEIHLPSQPAINCPSRLYTLNITDDNEQRIASRGFYGNRIHRETAKRL